MSETIKNIIITIIVGLCFCHSIINIVFSFIYEKYDFERTIAYEINKSLKGKLLYSFKLKEECDGNEESFILDRWDGLKKGCRCSDRISSSSCSKSSRRRGCVDVQETKPEYYKIFNSKKICVRKSQKTYIELLLNKDIIDNNSECPSDYKCCGIIDTLNRRLCAKESEECPITLNDFNKSDEFSQFLPNPYQLDNFLNSNDDDKQILSIFQLTEGIPCLNPSEKEWTTHYELDYSMKKCSKINGEKYDLRYEKITNYETTKYDLYKDNYIINYYPNNLYGDFSKEKIYLYGRSFIGYNYEDIKGFSYEKLLTAQKISNRCTKGMNSIAIPAAACGGINLLIFLIALILYKGVIDWHDYEMPKILLRLSVCIVVQFLSMILYFIFNVIIFAYGIKIKSILNIQGNDDYANNILKTLLKTLSFNYIYCLISVILFIIIIILIIIFFLYKKYTY